MKAVSPSRSARRRRPSPPVPAGLENLFRSAPVGIALLDRTLRFLRVNRGLAAIHGLPVESHIGRTLREVVPDLAPAIEPAVRRVIRTGARVPDFEAKGSTPAHPEICCLVSCFPVPRSDGGALAVGTVIVDVTDRKRAEEALLRSEDHLRAMADSFPMFISYVDAERRYRFNNAHYEKVLGIPRARLQGKFVWEVLGEAAYAVLRPHMDAALGGRPERFHAEVPIPGAGSRHFNASFLPRLDEGGKVRGFYVLVADETERVRAEEALRIGEERYRTLVENSPDAIVVFDLDSGHFVECNGKALDLFGLDRDRLLRVGPVEVSPPLQPDGRSSAELAREYVELALAGQKPVFEWVHLYADGREIPCEIRLVRFPHRTRRLVRGSITDISRRKQAEAERRRDEERLRRLLESTHVVPWEADARTCCFTYVGPKAEGLLGYPVEKWYEEDFWIDHLHPEDREEAVECCHRSAREGRDFEFEFRMIDARGKVVWIHNVVHVVGGEPAQDRLRGFLIDVTARKRAEMLLAGQKRVLELQARGEALPAVLTELARAIDGLQAGMRSTILLLDEEAGRLRHGAAPNLPEEYNRAIDGMAIGPEAGSCGTAAFLGKRVIVTDTFTDPLWKNFRRLARKFGLRACWSHPILSGAGKVLGTFAMYHPQPYRPGEWELGLVEQAAYLAGVAIENTRASAALKRSEAALRSSHHILQDLAAKLLTAQEDERRRLARELHDDLTQELAALAIEIGKLEGGTPPSPRRLRGELGRLRDRLARLSEDVHGISRRLHPSILEDLGLVDAIASECRNLSERERIRVDFEPKDVPERFPLDVSLCLYRVVQEGLRNVVKHSGARSATVSLKSADGHVRLTIRDSGVGFVPGGRRGRGGLGLAGMRERVRLIRGDLSIRSRPGRGTVIEVDAPLGKERE
ncbi:MAG: PAS domain S-box protein [Acidobacteria bacterium]|nr:PAS domain S-box protein [Acidobacteriota bacterium]